MRHVLRGDHLGVGAINVCWQPRTQVFTFPIGETATAVELKEVLWRVLACEAHRMHLNSGLTQLRGVAPLSQHAISGDTVIANPKRGG